MDGVAISVKDIEKKIGVCPECGNYHIVIAYEAGIKDALANQWISVDERLPEEGQRVISKDMGVIGPATYNNGVWWNSVTGLHNITHWIPMPDLPK